MADVKKTTDAKDEVTPPSASAQAADAAGAQKKLEADSKTTTPTAATPETPATDKPATTAAATPATDANKDKPGTPEHKDEPEEEKSIWERASAFWDSHNSIDEIKGMFDFGKAPTAADKAKLPKVDVEGDKTAANPEKPDVPVDATAAARDAAETDPTKKDSSWLGGIGDALAWGVSALTPDPVEKACAGLWDATTDWFSDTFGSIGVDNKWEFRAVMSDSVYSSQTSDIRKLSQVNNALEGVNKEEAFAKGTQELEKVKEAAKKNNDLKTGTSGADAEISRQTGKSAEEIAAIESMLTDGLKGKLTTDKVDEKSKAKVQIDDKGNSRVENPDGSVTIKLADGTSIHKTADGKETWFNKDKNGFVEKQANGNWESASGSEYRQGIGAAEVLIDVKSKYNFTEVLTNSDFVQSLADAVAAVDKANERAIRIDKGTGEVILQDKSGEYKVDKETHQILKKVGDEWVALKDGETPPFKIEVIKDGPNAGGLKIGNIIISKGFDNIDIDRGNGLWHRLRRDGDHFKAEAEAPDPHKPGETAKITTDATPTEVISTDSEGNKRVINAETGEMVRTDSNGNVTLKHNPNTGETWTPDVSRDASGDIHIASSGITLSNDGRVISSSGAVIGDSGSSGSHGLSRAEAARIESQSQSTSAKVSSIGCMALSIARSGDPNALSILKHLAHAGIAMADAGLSMAAGHIPSIICLSLAKGIAVSALGVTNDQGRALQECTRLGIFDATTQKEAMIAGSIGSAHITPESAAQHFAKERRPMLVPTESEPYHPAA
jgi:hypothetical protein